MTTEQAFLKDIGSHVMEVIRDEGVYRHIRFRKPGTMCMHFDLITWPGYLCYTGDMGTYVFNRLRDMFEFFRTDRRDDGSLNINLSYWSEKLQAVDSNRHCGSAKEYSPERFEQIVKEQLVTWMQEADIDADGRRELREAVENDVLSAAHDGDVRTYDAANGFRETINGETFEFIDFWEYDLTDYTHRFTWCCYALAWGIKQYDDAMVTA